MIAKRTQSVKELGERGNLGRVPLDFEKAPPHSSRKDRDDVERGESEKAEILLVISLPFQLLS